MRSTQQSSNSPGCNVCPRDREIRADINGSVVSLTIRLVASETSLEFGFRLDRYRTCFSRALTWRRSRSNGALKAIAPSNTRAHLTSPSASQFRWKTSPTFC
eukprot:623854-Amorphochlora_amoeboformis.AAC.1